MRRITYIYNHFLREPLWFKFIAVASLVAAVLFSSSYFAGHDDYPSIAKIAAAVFFTVYGISFRSNRRISLIFYGAALFCMVLAVIYWI